MFAYTSQSGKSDADDEDDVSVNLARIIKKESARSEK